MNKTKEVYFYRDEKNKCYLAEWLSKIDCKTRARILNRILRLEYGAYGDHKNINGKIYELRFCFNKGYRVYFIEESNKIIVLLNAGDKDSQSKDIKKAKQLLNEYLKNRKNK